jgi:hypothetical protein
VHAILDSVGGRTLTWAAGCRARTSGRITGRGLLLPALAVALLSTGALPGLPASGSFANPAGTPEGDHGHGSVVTRAAPRCLQGDQTEPQAGVSPAGRTEAPYSTRGSAAPAPSRPSRARSARRSRASFFRIAAFPPSQELAGPVTLLDLPTTPQHELLSDPGPRALSPRGKIVNERVDRPAGRAWTGIWNHAARSSLTPAPHSSSRTC